MDVIQTLDPESALLAPWKFCSLDEDEGDVLGSVVDSLQSGECTGSDKLNSLAWDVTNSKDIFESLPDNDKEKIKARFLMTNGGLTMVSPAR